MVKAKEIFYKSHNENGGSKECKIISKIKFEHNLFQIREQKCIQSARTKN